MSHQNESTHAFLIEATNRGFLHQCTDSAALSNALSSNVVSAYTGFDCTADSLHVGHLLPMMLLRLLAKHGHRPVALLGTGTTKIGDPSFREEARKLLTDDEIRINSIGIADNLRQILPDNTLIFENDEWISKISYIDLLRDVGVHFSVNRMLGFDSVKSRLDREQGMTFLEFNYSILQSFDFRELNRNHNVTLQIGGSDQWGNIVSGVDLIRRTDAKTVFGLTTQLLTTAAGDKMGKTTGGAVWLSASKLPVFDYWQFWRNCQDADVKRFLQLFTELPLDNIDELTAHGGNLINNAKIVLATEATAIVHGRTAAEKARDAAIGINQIDSIPVVHINQEHFTDGLISILDVLLIAKLSDTRSEARRNIRNRGVYMNRITVTEESLQFTPENLNGIMMSIGAKRHRIIKVV